MSIITRIIKSIDKSVYRFFGYKAYYNADELKKMYVDFFKKAEESIWILAGEFAKVVFEDEAVIGALKTAADRNVKVVLIGGDSPDTYSKMLWEVAREGGFEYKQLKERPDVHFAIVDKKEVRGEYPHLPKSYSRSGFFTSTSPYLLKNLTKRFKDIEKDAIPSGYPNDEENSGGGQ